jgi:hypothetical protein
VDNTFRAKIRAAAVAAWWTLLIAAAFFVIQWLGYLLAVHAKPEWVLSLWGPGATWDGIAPVWFHALVLMKLSLWPIAIAALWLTLWARQLRVGPPNS